MVDSEFGEQSLQEDPRAVLRMPFMEFIGFGRIGSGSRQLGFGSFLVCPGSLGSAMHMLRGSGSCLDVIRGSGYQS